MLCFNEWMDLEMPYMNKIHQRIIATGEPHYNVPYIPPLTRFPSEKNILLWSGSKQDLLEKIKKCNITPISLSKEKNIYKLYFHGTPSTEIYDILGADLQQIWPEPIEKTNHIHTPYTGHVRPHGPDMRDIHRTWLNTMKYAR